MRRSPAGTSIVAPDDDWALGQELVDVRNEERFARSGRDPETPLSEGDMSPSRGVRDAPEFLTDSSGASRPVIYRPGFPLKTRLAVVFVMACLAATAWLLLLWNGQGHLG